MSIYAVNKLCYRIVQEPELRRTLEEDPRRAVAEARPALSEEEAQAFLASDVGKLSKLGANHFLLHQIGRFGIFGLDLPRYAERIRAAYR